jgi:peptidoglycan/LPS O-acetylase OafA/YrhL
MASVTGNKQFHPTRPLGRDILRVALATAALLLVPLVAMQFTAEVKWDGLDFVVAAVLLGGTGLAWVLLSRRLSGRRQRTIAGALLLAALLLVWAQLAVGIVN